MAEDLRMALLELLRKAELDEDVDFLRARNRMTVSAWRGPSNPYDSNVATSYPSGEVQQHVYFPTGCLVAVLVQLSNRRTAQVGLTGARVLWVCQCCYKPNFGRTGSSARSAAALCKCQQAIFETSLAEQALCGRYF